jgi:hypothetical protein
LEGEAHVRWTRKTIISEIKRLHDANEELYYSKAEDNHLNLVRAAGWHFGTWRRAIEAAGIDYESLSKYQRWNKKKVVERIRELHTQGQDLNWRAVSTHVDPPLAAAALRANGYSSWRDAIAAAGLDIESVARYKEWDDEKVLKAIRARKRAGLSLFSKSLQVEDQSLFCAARRRFGSWDGALNAAGFKAENIRLRRYNPALNAPRRKKENISATNAANASSSKSTAPKSTAKAPAVSPNGKASGKIQITTRAAATKAAGKASNNARAIKSATKASEKPASTAPRKAAKKVATKAASKKASAGRKR